MKNPPTNPEAPRILRIPDINTELYLRALPDIRLALSPLNIQAKFQDTAGKYLGAGTMTVLEFAVNELGKYHHEEPIPKEDLDSIRAEASELLAEIEDATIDDDLRMILMDSVGMVVRSIDEYRIRGAAGMRDIVAFSIGQFVLNHDLYEKTKNESVVKRFSAIVGKISTVVAASIKVYQLYGKVAPILGLPPVDNTPPE
jgi:hypothetical protein